MGTSSMDSFSEEFLMNWPLRGDLSWRKQAQETCLGKWILSPSVPSCPVLFLGHHELSIVCSTLPTYHHSVLPYIRPKAKGPACFSAGQIMHQEHSVKVEKSSRNCLDEILIWLFKLLTFWILSRSVKLTLYGWFILLCSCWGVEPRQGFCYWANLSTSLTRLWDDNLNPDSLRQ